MRYYEMKRDGSERNPNCPYLPLMTPVDTTLDRDEYYVEVGDKIYKGRVVEIYSDMHDNEYFVLYNGKGKIHSGCDLYGGFRKYNMYDNKEDCRDAIHWGYDAWEV